MVYQYRVQWQGVGGPGLSVFNARLALDDNASRNGFASACRTFFNSLASVLPSDINLSFPAEMLQLNTSTGILEAVYGVTAPAPVVGGSAGNYPAPAGARIDWQTGAIVNGRRLQGRTYIVPLITTSFDPQGTIAEATRTQIQNAATTFLNTMQGWGALGVWSRPKEAVPPPDPKPARAGVIADIQTAVVPDEVAVLRSRRD